MGLSRRALFPVAAGALAAAPSLAEATAPLPSFTNNTAAQFVGSPAVGEDMPRAMNPFEHAKMMLEGFKAEWAPDGNHNYRGEVSFERKHHHPHISALKSISPAVAYRMQYDRRRREEMLRRWRSCFSGVPAPIKAALGIGDEPPGL